MVLANFIFGDLNAVRHTHACINYYWWALNFANFANSNCQIKNLTKVSCYYIMVIAWFNLCVLRFLSESANLIANN